MQIRAPPSERGVELVVDPDPAGDEALIAFEHEADRAGCFAAHESGPQCQTGNVGGERQRLLDLGDGDLTLAHQRLGPAQNGLADAFRQGGHIDIFDVPVRHHHPHGPAVGQFLRRDGHTCQHVTAPGMRGLDLRSGGVYPLQGNPLPFERGDDRGDLFRYARKSALDRDIGQRHRRVFGARWRPDCTCRRNIDAHSWALTFR